MSELRIGHGYDVHKLVSNRKLVLGGVEIPFKKGLLGHSDADVLLHAVMDACLGALGEGDIGLHFPDHDDRFLGTSSMHLLTLVYEIMALKKASVVNLDATVIVQQPKIAPYIETMKNNIAFALSCPVSCINVKATTEEGLGFTGNGEGIAAHAVVLLSVVG